MQRVSRGFAGAERLGIHSRIETYGYRTPNGYEERERLVVSKDRAMVHVHIYRFGSDIFLGWHAYLNWAGWTETAPVTQRVENGVVTEFRDLRPGVYVPSQLDLIDLNGLGDFVHRRLEREIKTILKERHLDQEIDFEIIRGDRNRALDKARNAPAADERSSGVWSRIMGLASAWQPASETEIARVSAPTRTGRHGSASDGEDAARWRRRLLPWLGVLVGVGIWEALVSILRVAPYILPPPHSVALAFASNFGLLMANLWPTAMEAASGFVIGSSLAILLASVSARRQWLSETFLPLATAINSIALIAAAPTLLLALGIGFASKIWLTGVICFFSTFVTLMQPLPASQPQITWKARLYGLLFPALRVSASLAVVGAIVGEWLGSSLGIGSLLSQSASMLNAPLLYATVLLALIFSILFLWAISLLEHVAMQTQRSA
jgi:NitT/TauT family transport system permease protein